MTTRTEKITAHNPYIAVTPDYVIFVEARPPVTADEIAYYKSDGSPVLKVSPFWGIIIGVVFALAVWGLGVAAFCFTK
jgi:hypothetical protein